MTTAGVDRLHFLGICGTFMGGLALLARQLGYRVSGCDQNVYPPMSALLESQGIDIQEGYYASHLEPAPDLVVVGNAMVRGMDAIEYMLDQRLPYVSGPQWLGEQVLRHRHVLAVAGTHGKTTTTSMLAWILEQAELAPGFLVGGVPANFDVSARLGGGTHNGQGSSNYFVIEADEYDTAFFDKRSKFVHYHPRTLILNNLEYDHADIFPDLVAIETQCHHVVRIVPERGQVIANGASSALARVLERGCWSTRATTGWVGDTPAVSERADDTHWRLSSVEPGDGVDVLREGERLGVLPPNVRGRHNAENALAAIAAAAHVGVAPSKALEALASFEGVARRLERVDVPGDLNVYDDFAHHPTAVARTLETLRQEMASRDGRLIAVLEPRSNTMRMGAHGPELAAALAQADQAWLYAHASLDWDASAILGPTLPELRVHTEVEGLAQALAQELRRGDTAVLMSNGAFGGLRQRLREALQERVDHP
ncbi:MAG: UDP-N-acetylmuramate:L-alanyl-gamma-D-glutamyl-meso-diaminopimelate ligase [Pseudomonadota bacterium]